MSDLDSGRLYLKPVAQVWNYHKQQQICISASGIIPGLCLPILLWLLHVYDSNFVAAEKATHITRYINMPEWNSLFDHSTYKFNISLYK